MANRQIDELTYASTITDATSIPVNNNTATYEAQQLTVGKLGDFLGSRASAVHNLGDVYTNKSSLVIDNPGALPAWTGEYITNANNTYPDLYTWLKTSHSELCVTRAAYDAAITADGECKYFVIDEESGSIRFPKYSYTAPEYPWIYCFNAAVPQTTTQGAEYTASLISKVSKAGDTMTGQLVMANGSNGIKFQGTNDNNYYVNYLSNNLTLLGQNGKGILLDSNNNNTPYYTDGTTNTSLIPTIPNWGSIGGTITNQTDLTTYINQLISAGVSKMLGRINYNNASQFTITYSASGRGTAVNSQSSSTYTFSSDGYIVYKSQGSSSLTTVTFTLNNIQINNKDVPLTTSQNSLIPVSQGDVAKCSATVGFSSTFSFNWSANCPYYCIFYPQK